VFREGTKPPELHDLSPSCSETYPGELSFQEGRPLTSSDEEEGLFAPKTGTHSPDREAFMVCISEIQHMEDESPEQVQLNDYYINDDDYFSDTPDHDMNTTDNFSSNKLPDLA
jgi:hypothetical protein